MKKIPKLSIVLGMLIFCLFFTGCDKNDDIENIEPTAITQISVEEITPTTIINGKVNPKELDKKQRIQFLKTYDFLRNDKFSKSEILEASHLVMFDLKIEDLTEVIAYKNTEISEAKLWEKAYILKEQNNIGWLKYLSKIIDLVETKDFDNNEELVKKSGMTVEEIKTMHLEIKKISEQAKIIASDRITKGSRSLMKSANCSPYSFSSNGIKATIGNINCFYVSKGSTPDKPNDCDYLLTFGSLSKKIKCNSYMNFIIETHFGYNDILLKLSRGRTYMLIGNGIDIYFLLSSETEIKNYLKQNIKLKV